MTTEIKRPYNLVEKTSGPWNGKIWRTEDKTESEAIAANEKIQVMQWEPQRTYQVIANRGRGGVLLDNCTIEAAERFCRCLEANHRTVIVRKT